MAQRTVLKEFTMNPAGSIKTTVKNSWLTNKLLHNCNCAGIWNDLGPLLLKWIAACISNYIHYES